MESINENGIKGFTGLQICREGKTTEVNIPAKKYF